MGAVPPGRARYPKPLPRKEAGELFVESAMGPLNMTGHCCCCHIPHSLARGLSRTSRVSIKNEISRPRIGESNVKDRVMVHGLHCVPSALSVLEVSVSKLGNQLSPRGRESSQVWEWKRRPFMVFAAGISEA